MQTSVDNSNNIELCEEQVQEFQTLMKTGVSMDEPVLLCTKNHGVPHPLWKYFFWVLQRLSWEK